MSGNIGKISPALRNGYFGGPLDIDYCAPDQDQILS